jgi:hypothetical protein
MTDRTPSTRRSSMPPHLLVRVRMMMPCLGPRLATNLSYAVRTAVTRSSDGPSYAGACLAQPCRGTATSYLPFFAARLPCSMSFFIV